MKLLVTGGTGFLGRRAVVRLAARHDLALLVRPAAKRDGFPAGVRFVEGDVTDRASLEAAMADREGVIHAAALVKIVAPRAEFERVNVGGLENVLGAAASAGVRKIVYISSFIALGPSENAPGGVLDEGAEVADRRWINDYERTKAMADRSARRAIETGAPLSVVYPGVTYGAGELTEGNIVVRHLLDLANGRLPALIGRPERRWNYVHVDDVAEGIARVVEGARPGSRYVLGGENVTLGEFYRLVAEIGKIPVPARRMSDGLAKTAGFVMKLAARLSGGVPQLTPDLVEVYRHDWAYDSTRARADLDYRSRPLAKGLAETFAWLRTLPEWPQGNPSA